MLFRSPHLLATNKNTALYAHYYKDDANEDPSLLPTPPCPLCNTGRPGTSHHAMYECPSTSTARETFWEAIYNTFDDFGPVSWYTPSTPASVNEERLRFAALDLYRRLPETFLIGTHEKSPPHVLLRRLRRPQASAQPGAGSSTTTTHCSAPTSTPTAPSPPPTDEPYALDIDSMLDLQSEIDEEHVPPPPPAADPPKCKI